MEVDWPDAEDMAREQIEWWQANDFTVTEALAALGVYGNSSDLSWSALVHVAAYTLLSPPTDALNLEHYRLKK